MISRYRKNSAKILVDSQIKKNSNVFKFITWKLYLNTRDVTTSFIDVVIPIIEGYGGALGKSCLSSHLQGKLCNHTKETIDPFQEKYVIAPERVNQFYL
jgi:hypothetical protein